MTLDDKWFIEASEAEGLGLALGVTEKLHEERSEFQTIAVYETTRFGRLMTIDGLVMLTDRDNFIYHEMMSHPVLFTHTAPRRVAIIGGGDCGTLREVLKHREVEEVWQVDIDERVTRVSERYFPELCESNHDPRAHLLFDDGLKWVKDAEPGSVDVIVVDSTDPIGPAEGLFNRAFYADCLRALGEGGLLVQQSESPLLHMKLLKDMHAAMRDAGFADVRTLQFPQPTYPSGWWTATLARKGSNVEGFREADAAELATTRYYTADIHRAAFVMPRFFNAEIGG